MLLYRWSQTQIDILKYVGAKAARDITLQWKKTLPHAWLGVLKDEYSFMITTEWLTASDNLQPLHCFHFEYNGGA